LDWCPIFCGIDFRPKVFTIGIQAWLIGIDPLPAVLLPMALAFAEDAGHFVPIGIISWIRSSLLLISRVVTEVVLGSEIWPSLVAVLLLASILVRGVGPWFVLRDSLNVIFLLFLLNRLYLVLTLVSSLERSSMVARRTAISRSSMCIGWRLMTHLRSGKSATRN